MTSNVVKFDSKRIRQLANQFVAPVQALLSRAGIAMRAGLQANGLRDLYQVFGYTRIPRHADFVSFYLREDIAKRVVNAPADGVWSDPPEVNGPGDLKEQFIKLAKNHDIWSVLHRLDICVGLGQFAILLVGIDDGRPLNMPVRKREDAKILYLQPYLEGAVRIVTLEQDTSSPRYGKPLLYEIQTGLAPLSENMHPAATQSRRTIQVHWSRVLHVAENTLESQLWGHSRMEAVLNALYDLVKVGGGAAECFWLTANRGMQLDVDKEVEFDEEDAEALSAEAEEYQHGLRRFIRTRGVKITPLGNETASPSDTFEVLLARVSAATGMPKRMIIGSEAGQLASQQDRAEWSVRLAERIANFAEPGMLRPFIYQLQSMGIIPEFEPHELTIEWPEAFKLNPLERAQTAAQMARSLANVAKAMETQTNMQLPIITVGEARAIVGFGKHVPVLDAHEGTPKDIDEDATLGEKEEPKGAFGQPATPTATPPKKD
jgi:hypothetical protein